MMMQGHDEQRKKRRITLSADEEVLRHMMTHTQHSAKQNGGSIKDTRLLSLFQPVRFAPASLVKVICKLQL
jgi:hypothetical protein